MTIKALYPNIIPSLSLDFANVENLDPRITFARASTATYYNGVTTAKAEENLLAQSQAYNNASWANIGTTETDNAATAPDGTSTAAILDDGTATSGHDISGSGTITAGVTYTASAFFKNVDRQFVILACSTGTNAWASTKFDLTAGTAGSTSAAGAGWSTTSSSITSVGNSWFRCTMTFVPGTTGSASIRLGMATDDTTFTAGQRGLESYTGTNATVEIWGAQLEQRSAVTAYTPTTTQPITNYVPVLLSAANNVARFDHNPVTGESLGLLIEEQRTNLVVRSEELNSTSWDSRTRISTGIDFTVAPNGAQAADQIIENTESGEHGIQAPGANYTSGTAYTFSIYAKRTAGAARNLRVLLPIAAYGENKVTIFDLSNGSVLATSGSGITATSANVGNGWYRLSMSAVATATVSSTAAQLRLAVGTTVSYQGNGFDGLFIWGAQLEAGAFPTSYIPTVASQVTRSADAASMTGADFSSWYNQAEGTVYAEAQTSAQPSSIYHYVASINQGSSSFNAGGFLRVSFNTLPKADLTIGNSGSFTTLNTAGFPTLQYGVFSKMSIAWQNNDAAGTSNGVTPSTTTTRQAVSPSDTLFIGSQLGSTRFLNGTIKKLAFYPKRLADAELVALTT